MCTTCMPDAHRGHERTSDLELKSWMIVSYYMMWDI